MLIWQEDHNLTDNLVSIHKWLFLSALRLDSPPYGWVPGFRNLDACPVKCEAYFTGVNLRDSLCDVLKYVSA